MKFEELRERFNSDNDDMLNESKKKSKGKRTQDPPPVLMLRRTGVRVFPNGERVALYHNAKLGLNFSVPYTDSGYNNPVTANEGVLQEELLGEDATVIQRMAIIAKKREMGEVVFDNGVKTKIDVTTAESVLRLLGELTPSNRERVTALVNGSLSGLSKVRDFAFKNLK